MFYRNQYKALELQQSELLHSFLTLFRRINVMKWPSPTRILLLYDIMLPLWSIIRKMPVRNKLLWKRDNIIKMN